MMVPDVLDGGPVHYGLASPAPTPLPPFRAPWARTIEHLDATPAARHRFDRRLITA